MIWIVIAVHNRKDFTRACLESLSRQNYKEFKIIIVDDGSSDGTEEMIKSEFPHVILLKGSGNLFWTKATNLGVKEALNKSQENDYVLTLNNDVVVGEGYLGSLFESAQEFQQAVIGSIALSSVDGKTIIDGGVRINWLTAKFKTLMAGKCYQEILNEPCLIQDVDVLSGRGTLIPIKVFKKIGLYNDQQLPHYAADYEFSVRAKKAGYSLLINYRANVISNTEATGLNNAVHSLNWKDYLKSFVSIRSPNNLYYRWNFSRLCCPGAKGVLFYILGTIRVIFGSLRNQIARTWK